MASGLAEWILHLRAQKRSPATLLFYRRYVGHYAWWLTQQDASLALADLTPARMRAFMIYLQEPQPGGRWTRQSAATARELRPRAVDAYWRTLHAFAAFLVAEGHIPTNPLERVARPKVPDRWRVTTLTDTEIQALFAACARMSHPPMAARNRAILAVLLDAAVRAGELLRLQCGDIDGTTGQFRVVGKGKGREVALGPAARAELRAYLVHRQTQPDGALFLSQLGAPLTYNGLKELFRRLGTATGVHVHAHKCRHTAATLMHRRGMRGSVLQEILGHASFDVTRRYYLDVSREDLRAEHEQYAPLDALKLIGPNGAGGKAAAAALPAASVLAREVAASSYRSVGRKYGVSDVTIRNRVKAG